MSSAHVVPAPWQECWTDDGYAYYYNTVTQETVWELPTATPAPAPAPAAVPALPQRTQTTPANRYVYITRASE